MTNFDLIFGGFIFGSFAGIFLCTFNDYLGNKAKKIEEQEPKEIKIRQYTTTGLTPNYNVLITEIRKGYGALWRQEDIYTASNFEEIKDARLSEAEILIEKFKTL